MLDRGHSLDRTAKVLPPASTSETWSTISFKGEFTTRKEQIFIRRKEYLNEYQKKSQKEQGGNDGSVRSSGCGRGNRNCQSGTNNRDKRTPEAAHRHPAYSR